MEENNNELRQAAVETENIAEEGQGKKKKREKKPKEPKQPKAKKEKPPKEPKPKKEKKPKEPKAEKEKSGGGGAAGFIFAFLIILAVGAVFALTYFNVFDMKAKAAGILGLDTYIQDAVEQKENELQIELDLVKAKEKELSSLEKELNNQKKNLDSKEEELKTLQDELGKLQAELEGSKADLEATVATFEQMDAKAAAEILSKLKLADIVKVMNKLTPQKSAAILNEMDRNLASKIVAAMVKE
ncbi:hypothetical protein LJC55_01075 [Eubacteriales bacterium OttesenSCG-928-N14]|nr:hypothetical protein [Eubacteriales bacterium OttesenSCG-928-N14]